MGNLRHLRPPRLDDAALVAPAAHGEEWAAEELWRRFSTLVRGIVLRTLGPDRDAHDLVQESFLQLFGSLKHLKDPTSLRSFLIGITIRVVRSELRRRRVRRFLRLTETGNVPDTASVDVDHDAREAVRNLYVALAKLGDEAQIVFTLRYIECLELTEIARALDLSLATVKRRLDKTTERLTALAVRDPLLSGYVRRASEEVEP